ncbi:MAG: hypothetical protein AB7G06_00425 [Bdellovibrionales bacterium]
MTALKPRLVICALESPADGDLVKPFSWRRAVPGLRDIYYADEFNGWNLRQSQNFNIKQLPKIKGDLQSQVEVYEKLWREADSPLALVIPAKAMNIFLQKLLHTRIPFDAAGVIEIEQMPSRGIDRYRPRALGKPARKS